MTHILSHSYFHGVTVRPQAAKFGKVTEEGSKMTVNSIPCHISTRKPFD